MARPRHFKIQNVLNTKWIVQVDLIVNMFCQRRESDFYILLIMVIYASYARAPAYLMIMPHMLEKYKSSHTNIL
jgi:hypothetical protein